MPSVPSLFVVLFGSRAIISSKGNLFAGSSEFWKAKTEGCDILNEYGPIIPGNSVSFHIIEKLNKLPAFFAFGVSKETFFN